MRRHAPSVRLCALILCLAVAWAAAGAPLTRVEWQSIPDRFGLMLRQIPMRMRNVLIRWLPEASAETRVVNLTLSIWDPELQAARSILLEDYVAGVVAAEMPARYHPEALACQAVAARTFAIRQCRELGGSGCKSHPGSDACIDSACCQGYLTPAAQRDKWPGEYTAMAARVESAVRVTAGQILTYDGMPIEALYHASSGGMTEDAAEVFSSSRPYLISVDSPGEEGYAGYVTQITFSRSAAVRMLTEAFPDCGVTEADLPNQLELRSSTASGRVDTVSVGSRLITGAQLRQALGLRSTLCTWDCDEDSITFQTRGYGHGVGMSQAGAQAMAAAGETYADILAHYYPGTHLSLLPPMNE
ncbi:MAG: stage II sporulation protein D [Christensenellaceae bacterium]|nr:stage II sporulation protein D [Christensenellaceae bacterium]